MNIFSIMKDLPQIMNQIKEYKEEVKTWDLTAQDSDNILSITIDSKGKIIKCIYHKEVELEGKEYRNKVTNAIIEAQEKALEIYNKKTKEKLKGLNIPPALMGMLGV